MADNNTHFEDAETYGFNYGKDKLTFKDIVLLHLKKIGGFASCEWRGGYWEEKPHPNIQYNAVIRTYVPDTRETYSNAVGYLHDILYVYFDKKMKEASETAEKETEEALNDNTIEQEKDRGEETEEEIEEEITQEVKKYHRKFGSIDNRMTYRKIRAEINRKLFRALCCFLYRKKYLDLGAIED